MTLELLAAMSAYAQDMVLEDLMENAQEIDLETLDLDKECQDLSQEKWGADIIARVRYADFVSQ